MPPDFLRLDQTAHHPLMNAHAADAKLTSQLRNGDITTSIYSFINIAFRNDVIAADFDALDLALLDLLVDSDAGNAKSLG